MGLGLWASMITELLGIAAVALALQWVIAQMKEVTK